MYRHSDMTGRAGEHYVAAEINRRGAYASPFSGNVPGIDVVAADHSGKRTVYIQVKTARRGSRWHVSVKHGWEITEPGKCLALGRCDPSGCKSDHEHHWDDVFDLEKATEIPGTLDHYWVFVSLEKLEYWIVPDAVVRAQLRARFRKYLTEKFGHRPGRNHASQNNMVVESELTKWKGAWDELGIDFIISSTDTACIS